MAYYEDVQQMSGKISNDDMIKACLLFSNHKGTFGHYNSLKAIGIEGEELKKMDSHNIIWYWRRWLIALGTLKRVDSQSYIFVVERV